MTMAYAQAVIAAAALTAQIVQGNRQNAAQKASLRAQDEAQKRALSEAMRTDELNAQQQKAAMARAPDVTQLLADAQTSSTALNPTTLTGPLGVQRSKVRLGQPGMLGG